MDWNDEYKDDYGDNDDEEWKEKVKEGWTKIAWQFYITL